MRCVFLIVLIAAAAPAGQDTLKQVESRALELRSRGDAAGSLAEWEKAEKLAPKSANIQDQIGFLLAVLNRQQEAIGRFETSIALDAKFAPAHYHLGVACWLAGNRERAVRELQAAMKLDPGNRDYHLYLGKAFNSIGLDRQNSGDLAGALDIYRQAVEADPSNLDARNNLGFMLVNTGHPEEGVGQFRKILDADP
ncbi:MAG TPA: tetratricopeptide repeat protein, partial [Bryobacteraceae bacterium]|nr:tetratricopeptide repeat protein [Bryobacteraceae bacterium]